MSFNRKSRLDPSQVEDRRGQRGRGTAIAVGGGGLGLIITGKSATLPAGSPLEGRVRNDVTLDWPTR